MNNISHLHDEKLGQVVGFHDYYDHITMRYDHHHHYQQLMDSGCRLRARTVGRRQQRAAPAWESTTSFAPPAFCTFKPFVLDCSCKSNRYKEGQYCLFLLNLDQFM